MSELERAQALIIETHRLEREVATKAQGISRKELEKAQALIIKLRDIAQKGFPKRITSFDECTIDEINDIYLALLDVEAEADEYCHDNKIGIYGDEE